MQRQYRVAAGGRFIAWIGQTQWPLAFAILFAQDLRMRGYVDAHPELALEGVGPLALTLAICPHCRGTGHAGGDTRSRWSCLHCLRGRS